MSAALLRSLAAYVRIERGLPGWSGPILNAQGTSHEEM
jgi:hypothetical protein